MATEIELLTEIRDLLQIMAEPQIAERDRRLRDSLRTAVGRSANGQKAVSLMDGSRKQADIVKLAGISKGQLSPLVQKLTEMKLIANGDGKPRLVIRIPGNFFENGVKE